MAGGAVRWLRGRSPHPGAPQPPAPCCLRLLHTAALKGPQIHLLLFQPNQSLQSLQRALPAALALSRRSLLARTASGAPPPPIRMISTTSKPRSFRIPAKSSAAFSKAEMSGCPWLVTITAFFPGARRELKPESMKE